VLYTASQTVLPSVVACAKPATLRPLPTEPPASAMTMDQVVSRRDSSTFLIFSASPQPDLTAGRPLSHHARVADPELTRERQRLVELHGGTISAHSEGHGHGSAFTVRFLSLVSHLPIQRTIVSSPW
jgi:hypothetical protein